MICHLAERKTRAAVAAAADFGACCASCRWCVLCAKCQMWKAEKPFLTEEERATRKGNKKCRLRATFHSQHVDIILLQQREVFISFRLQLFVVVQAGVFPFRVFPSSLFRIPHV